jgi:thioredoxin
MTTVTNLDTPKDKVVHIKDTQDFLAQLQNAGDKLVVADFTAKWCGPCKAIAPVFSKWSNEVDAVFLKVDVDDCEELSQLCGIGCMPTFQLYKNGKKIDECKGANPNNLSSTISKNL